MWIFGRGPTFSSTIRQLATANFFFTKVVIPQPHDDEVRIGQQWMIAIHDSREAEAKARSRVRDRLLMGQAYSEACPTGLVRPN